MSYTMTAPEVESSMTGKVPTGIYKARGVKVVAQADRHVEKKYLRTIISCEIVAPDIAVDEQSPDKKKYSVAGRKFRLYLPTDIAAKQYSEAYTAFSNLGYKTPDGNINLEQFWADVDAGTLFFYVNLSSKEQIVKNGDGSAWINPSTGQTMTKGWDLEFVQPKDVITRDNTGTPNPTVGAGLPY